MATRRASDAASGMDLKVSDYPSFSDAEVTRHFEMFKHYDLDNSGFITADNLLDVLKALDMDASMESVLGMIDEVALLTGHENDGKLSFRDFMNIKWHDEQVAEEDLEQVAEEDLAANTKNLGLETQAEQPGESEEQTALGEQLGESDERVAQEEQPTEIEEPESPVGAPAPAPSSDERPKGWAILADKAAVPPPMTKRRSSMSALNELAAGRIKAFQQVATDAAEREREKMAKFKKNPVVMTGPMVNSDQMHLETLQQKLKAFETAAHYQGKVETRKTWKKVGGASNYQAGHKILLGGMPAGVAPKKKLSELP